MNIIQWIQNHWTDLLLIYTSIVTIASIIVKYTKTIKDDTILLEITKWVSRYIALNRTVDDKAIREKLQNDGKIS